jgi:hypothetical protein
MIINNLDVTNENAQRNVPVLKVPAGGSKKNLGEGALSGVVDLTARLCGRLVAMVKRNR